MITQNDIIKTALIQSAIDLNCSPDDFFSGANKVVPSVKNDRARKYLKLPFACEFVSYGSNIVASASPEFADIAREFINNNPIEYCLEARELAELDKRLEPLSARVYRCGEYWLPELERLKPLECEYEIRTVGISPELYVPEWSNALCEDRKELDVLAVGAYDGNKLIGLAGCSADCDTMWQIGVDVLPEYRRKGIAAALTSRLALEILERGRVPFYCCAWSNIKSAKNAVKSGFSPAWAEVTVRKLKDT